MAENIPLQDLYSTFKATGMFMHQYFLLLLMTRKVTVKKPPSLTALPVPPSLAPFSACPKPPPVICFTLNPAGATIPPTLIRTSATSTTVVGRQFEQQLGS